MRILKRHLANMIHRTMTRDAQTTNSRRESFKRRTDIVGTFLNPPLLRLAGHVLIEQHDEWDGAEDSIQLPTATNKEVAIPELTAA